MVGRWLGFGDWGRLSGVDTLGTWWREGSYHGIQLAIPLGVCLELSALEIS